MGIEIIILILLFSFILGTLFKQEHRLKVKRAEKPVDIKVEVLRKIKEDHRVNLGTANTHNEFKDIVIRQVRVGDGKKIKQHLVQIFDKFRILILSADFTDFENPIFYDLTDGELIISENQDINYYINQIET